MNLAISYSTLLLNNSNAGTEFGIAETYLTLIVRKQQLAGYADECPHAPTAPSAR
jgi:hypothetical protein